MRSVWERWTKIVPVFYIPSCKAGAPLSACVVCLQTIHMHSSLEPVRFGSRFFCLCGDTRKKIVAIQITLFSACVDTRKNSRDLNRDSNRAFLVCGNAPNVVNFRKNLTLFLRCQCCQFQEETSLFLRSQCCQFQEETEFVFFRYQYSQFKEVTQWMLLIVPKHS